MECMNTVEKNNSCEYRKAEKEEILDDLAHARNILIKSGVKYDVIDEYAERLNQDDNSGIEYLDFFSIAANTIPYTDDMDYGALLLEYAAMNCTKDVRKILLLHAALERAETCASCATSGGEGIARSVHVNRIRKRIVFL